MGLMPTITVTTTRNDQAMIGPSVALPVAWRQLVLGTWQRVVLVELDGPRARTVRRVWR